jgi:hypothetical protein
MRPDSVVDSGSESLPGDVAISASDGDVPALSECGFREERLLRCLRQRVFNGTSPRLRANARFARELVERRGAKAKKPLSRWPPSHPQLSAGELVDSERNAASRA